MGCRILLADDHVLVREGLAALLTWEHFTVVAQAADGAEAVRLARELHPDVAILDVSMPCLNGIDAARAIAQESPRTRTIVVTMHSEDHYVVRALRAGVSGYVLKTRAASGLLQAINEVQRGCTYLSPGISRTVVQQVLCSSEKGGDGLSRRERQVLQLIAEGRNTKEIAAHLGLSAKTVETHRMRIMCRLDIHEIAGLVRYAIRCGIIQP